MSMRPDPLDQMKRSPADVARQNRPDARSLSGFGLLAGGIFPTAQVRNTATQAVAFGAGGEQVEFDTTDWDTTADEVAGHADYSTADLSNDQLVCRVTGVYMVSGLVTFAAVAVTAVPTLLWLERNGTRFAIAGEEWVNSSAIGTALQVHARVKLEPGDTIQLWVAQTTGVNRNISAALGEPVLSMTWEGMFSGTP